MMRITKKSIVTILVSLPFAMNAQKQAVTKIGIHYSADYTYRSLKPISPYYGQYTSINNLNESPAYGFNSGVTFLHQFKSGLILEGAAQYSRYAVKLADADIYDFNNQTVIGTSHQRQSYDYISIPVKIGYGLSIGNRVTLSATTGFAVNFLVNRYTHFKDEYTDGRYVRGRATNLFNPFTNYGTFNSFNLVSVSSIGVDVRLNNSFSIRLEPTLRYFVTAANHGDVQQCPYSLGISTMLCYRFKGHKE